MEVAVEGPDLDNVIPLEELVARTRQVIWAAMPAAHEAISALEARCREDGDIPGQHEYILEVSSGVFEDAVERADDEVIATFFTMCENLLEMRSGLIYDNVDDYVAKKLLRHHPQLVERASPHLRELIESH
ncbi:hypothetical protein [Nonomuraea endophytica]|uniref:Uncharacterized protein n=1 Tax=Nonomuraea endophytica TaxID=714136 RepID=A0A7W8AFA7_9ACTN|nr:hypothetical protein [Nonomuraea endophytica]MBB5085277.1 hypothetical protein [Nonomuraea endophytica]